MTEDGMTPAEHAALDALTVAWNLFVALPNEHPDDTTEFRHGVHTLQRQIMARPTRRQIYVMGQAVDDDTVTPDGMAMVREKAAISMAAPAPALPDARAGAVEPVARRVKLLEWERRDISIGSWHSAWLVWGKWVYSITENKSGITLHIENSEIGEFPSIEAAKAAAQADYEERNLYAAPPAPACTTGNAELDAGVPNHTDPNKRGFQPR